MTVLNQIGKHVRARLGIAMGPHKTYLLEARLERLRAAEGYTDLEALHRALESGDPKAQDDLARYLTTNHTFFFREPEHFHLLVDLLRRRQVSRPRVWSAAGSTGEEGYTLAMVLAEAGFQDFLVLVSDVNPDVLTRAARGEYEASRMEKIPPGLVSKYFCRLPTGAFRVADELKARLRFRRLNLVEELVVAQPLDVIFCRNLLIYFDDEGIQTVLGQLTRALATGGLLFLGQSEGFHRPPNGLRRVGPSVYQKTSAT